MKTICLSLLSIICVLHLHAQSLEVSLQANTGFSRYVGKSTVNTTFLDAANPADHSGYPNGDGNNPALNYGFAVQIQYIFKYSFLIGMQAGFETVSSKVIINGVYDGQQTETPATGYTEEHNGFVNLNPYIGYRFKIKNVKLDLMPGLDLALGAHVIETVNVTAADHTYYNKHTDNYYKPGDDVRLRLGFAAYYQKYGITASYSRGLDLSSPYADAYVPPEHIEIFRFGISYRLK